MRTLSPTADIYPCGRLPERTGRLDAAAWQAVYSKIPITEELHNCYTPKVAHRIAGSSNELEARIREGRENHDSFT